MIKIMFGSRKKIVTRKTRSKTAKRLEWHTDYEFTERVRTMVNELGFTHIPKHRIFCFRTEGSKARAYARIWAFPKIFQTVLDIEPAYVIEVLNKHYNKLGNEDQTKVIIHELLHIPKNFSGALLPHKQREKTIDKEVERLYRNFKKI
jgi:predicted metallopeptidase